MRFTDYPQDEAWCRVGRVFEGVCAIHSTCSPVTSAPTPPRQQPVIRRDILPGMATVRKFGARMIDEIALGIVPKLIAISQHVRRGDVNVLHGVV